MTEFITVAEAGRLIKARKISPIELTGLYLKRIGELDPQLNAFITVTRELALQQAQEAADEIEKGNHAGVLQGIPFGLKDIYNTRGIRTTGHSRICIDNVPDEDATVTRKLYDAGCILLGKLATHEFAHGGPSFDLPWPPARNPWNLLHFTGGSSSGSGAAVAAGLVPFALGSDTGGSIRGPASFCGVVGLKPSYGLVGRAGVIPNSFTLDHCGPITRTVEDCAIVLQAIAGSDAQDPASIHAPAEDYRAALRGGVKGMRIGVLRHYWEEDIPVHGDLARAMEEAISVFGRLGAKIEVCRSRSTIDTQAVKIIIAESEVFSIYRKDLVERPADFGRDFLGRVLPACLFQAADYVSAAREHRRIFAETQALFNRYDVLLTTGFGPAPRLDAYRTVSFWQRPNVFTPANLTAGPALVLCNGFSSDGFPLGMQLMGAPFRDATVLRAAHAYEQETQWHTRHPVLRAGEPQPPVNASGNEPDAAQVESSTRQLAIRMASAAGLDLDERQTAMLLEGAPYALEMVERIRKDRNRFEAPSLTFRVPVE